MAKHNETLNNVERIIKDSKKPISSSGILKILNDNPDTACDRKTVGRALETLRDMYGMDENGKWPDPDNKLYYTTTFRSSSPIYSKYYFVQEFDDPFTPEELYYLMGAVQSSRYVDKRFAKKIITKLEEFCHETDVSFDRYESIDDRHLEVNTEFLRWLGDINDAIRGGWMISFIDNRYGIDKMLHPVSEVPVEVCPFRIVTSDGYYWLLCALRDSQAVRSYRVDRLTEVVILDERFNHEDGRKIGVHNTDDFLAEHRYMHSGETVDVTLVIDRSILDDVLESFGSRIKIDKAPADANRYTVHVRSGEKDIIDWVMRYGGYAVLTEPDYLREEIQGRASRISSCYSDDDKVIKYLERIEKAESRHTLALHDIDLNGFDSYKYLEGIKTLRMSNNWIRDFSFLEGYTELEELMISNNEIGDPSYISELGNLRILMLENTGITDLGFLMGLERVFRLTIREYSLENIEGLYNLPNLKILTVNKSVARLLDKDRLRRVYGDSLRLIVSNRGGMLPLFLDGLPTRSNGNYNVRRYAEQMAAFTTCEVTDVNVRNELCSDIYGGKGRTRDKMFSLVDCSCDGEERTRLFKDIGHYAGSDYVWYVTSEDDTVFAISIFKRDHGLKLVGMARRNPFIDGRRSDEERALYEKDVSAVFAHIRYLMDNNICWCEISGELERLFKWICTMRDLIKPQVLADNNVFRGVDIELDDYHYTHKISGNKRSERKIAYGHIEVG